MSLVVVAGMKRSGTTWMFNVIRLALPGYQVSHDYHNVPDGDVILKTHWYSQAVADRADLVFSSDRDIGEVQESLERVTGETYTLRQMAKLVEHWRLWDQVADYRMDYYQLLVNPIPVAAGILAVLDVDGDPAAIVGEVAQLEPPESGLDSETFYLADHFS